VKYFDKSRVHHTFSQSEGRGTRAKGNQRKGELVFVEDKCCSFVFVSQRTYSPTSTLTAGVGQTYIAVEKVFETLNYTVI